MDWTTLRLAEWLPDQPDFENPGATVATNCYAAATSYKPVKALEAYSQSTGTGGADWIRGAVSIKDSSNTARVFAGNASQLLQLSATGWNDISIAGGYSSTAGQELWKFSQYGPDIVVATNYNNAVQKIVPGSAAVVLGGSPPRARYCATIKDWVVLAYLNDGAVRPNRVKWSGYNNSEYWGRNVALQADQQDLYDGGFITGLVEVGGSGLILQEDAVQLMRYEGPPVTFSFTRIANAMGTKVPGSLISYRDFAWWIGESDIWQYAGGQITPIASEKTAKTFFEDFDSSYKYRVTSAVDPVNNLVAWAYPGAGHVGGRPNRILIYSFNVGKWTLVEEDVECLFRFLSPGYTLESLDTISGSLDALSASLDSDVYKGGNLSFAAFDENKKLATFSGTPYSASLETAEYRAQTGRHTEITNLRPLFEGGVARVRVGTRAKHADAVTWTGPIDANDSGECNVRTNARFTRVRLELSGNWSHAIGVDAYLRKGGSR